MVTRPRDAYVARGYGLRIWAKFMSRAQGVQKAL